MIRRLFVLLVLASEVYAQTVVGEEPAMPKFMGRPMAVIEPVHEDELTTKGPASVCVEGPPQRQCYAAPEGFGFSPTAAVVKLTRDEPAILFSADARGISGSSSHIALLKPGKGDVLVDMFMSRIAISNQGRHAMWNDPRISEAPIFVTADYVWGPDESHYSEHRYIISAYLLRSSTLLDDPYYWLQDQFMTVRKYDSESSVSVLDSEKQEILSRLLRVKLEPGRRANPQH